MTNLEKAAERYADTDKRLMELVEEASVLRVALHEKETSISIVQLQRNIAIKELEKAAFEHKT